MELFPAGFNFYRIIIHTSGSPISGSSAVSTRSSSDSYSSSSSTRQLLSSVPATNETPLHILDVKMCDDKQHSLDKAVHV